MECTDFWKMEQEINQQAISELKTALNAHGGEYVFYQIDAEDMSDEEMEENDDKRENAPIVSLDHFGYGLISLIVSRISIHDDVLICGEDENRLGHSIIVSALELSASNIQHIIECMEEPGKHISAQMSE